MATKANSLANLLFGEVRGRVLGLLYGQVEQSFYVRQIARQIKGSVGAVQRELEKLAQLGLVERSESGHQVFYKANRRHPVFPEMRALLAKTVGVFAVLSAALAPVAAEIRLAFVYGSVARQEETASSDVDLMVIGDVPLETVLEVLSPVEAEIGRPINPTVYSESEFAEKLGAGNHFLQTVIAGPKVVLIGSEDELREVGGIRMAAPGSNERR